MRLFTSAAVITLAIGGNLHAQTVIENDNISFNTLDGFFTGFNFFVQQDAAATNSTSVSFAYDGSTVTPAVISIDEASDWYVVQPGDTFSRATIDAGNFTPLFTFPFQFHPPAFVGSGDFYLGVNTGIAPTFPDNRTAFGWVHLRPVDGMLTMVSNVMSYDSRGIIVGTTTLVPEPATLAVTGCGVLLLMSLSRRARQ